MAIHAPPKSNLVIFCGAGFSVPVGIPAMNRFGERLRSSGFLSPEEQSDLDHVQEVCDSLSSTIGASARNLEQLASFLSILELARPGFQFTGCHTGMREPREVTAKILQCISFLVRPDLEGDNLERAHTLTSTCSAANLTFITTNYDVHIELALARAKRRVRAPASGLQWRKPNTCANELFAMYTDDEDDSVPVFKLHGSVNWIENGDRVVAEDAVKIDTWNSEESPAKFGLQCVERGGDRSQVSDWCRSNRPVMVPPSVLKPSMTTNALLRSQWDGACKALSVADRLWFIGYSFPESDSFMRYFLGAALFKNSRLREIVVIDPDRDVIDFRARPMFAQPHHQEAFVGLPVTWERVWFGHLFNGNLTNAVDPNTVASLRAQLQRELTLSGFATEPDQHAQSASPRGRGRGRDRFR